MKRILCSLLVLSLLCAGVALADTEISTDGGTGETTITYTVPETPSEFTVLIPPSVSILQGQTSTTMEISIAGDSTLTADDTLSINLEKSANNFHLKLANGSDTIAYAVSKDGQPLSAGDTVLTWESGESIPAPAKLTMAITENIEEKTAGDYSDTLTFTVVLETTNV